MAISDTLSDIRKRLLDTGKTVQQLAQQPTQTLYQQALANQPYSFWNGGNYYQGVDYTDDEKAKFKQAGALYNSGDVNGAMDIVNGISSTGRFGGFYDDDGQYWGFAQGYKGGANGSYQPVFGGTLISKGLDTTGTDIWLTPDKKAYSLGSGGTLTDTGRGWTQYRTNPDNMTLYDIATNAGVNYGDMLGEMLGNGELAAYNNDPTRKAKREAVYHNLLGNPNEPAAMTTLPDNPNEPATLTPYGFTPSTAPSTPQSMSYQEYLAQNDGGQAAQLSAPGAYDPESDTLWQKYLAEYGNTKAPEYAGDPYQAQRDAALAAYGEKWQGSEYQPLRDEYLRKAADMEFSFDPNTDPVWQALQKQYLREGRRATEDTLGRFAAMTGGMPSTAAVSAATQAGDYYAAQLSDRLPEVYQQAYQRYLQEYQKQLGISDAYAGFDDREYSHWLDQQGKNLDLADRYNQYGQLDYQKYLDQLGQFNADRNFAYGAARDNQSLGRQMTEDQYRRYQDALSQANYEDETAYNRYRDTVADQQYDQEWAQKLREYADEQNWKTTEWEQYLREYGDKLSQQQREWAWEQAQAAQKNATPASYAYSQDGSVYDFSTDLAKDFVKNAPKGTQMKGSDGSIWRKDEYGNVSITKNGKTYYYGDQVPGQAQANGSGYRYTGGGNPRTAEEVYSPAPAPETPQGGGVQITNPVGNSGDTVNVDGQQFNWQELQRAYERGEVTAQYDERTGKYTFHTSTRKERIEDWNR